MPLPMPTEDKGYSDAANKATAVLGAKGNAEEDMSAGKGGPSPVTDALKLLAMFIQSREDAQDPQAAAMKEALLGLMDSFKAAAEAPAEAPGETPAQPEEQAPPEGETPAEAPPMSPGEEMAMRNKKKKKPQIL